MNDAARKVCQRPGCGGPESGVCIENFPFEECPHLIVLEDELAGESHAVPEDEAEAETGTSDYIATSLGAALDSSQCDAFLRRSKALVVAVVAGPEVGKTTLLSTIYELARRGEIDRVEFAGSETILGFERRCHLSRASSLLSVPDTPRTRVNGPQFLHLRLLIEEQYVDLLMADRPGENYTKAIESPVVLGSYEEIARADHVLLLVDGERLVNNPHSTIAGTRRLFRGMLENGLHEEQQVHLVITKVDLFVDDDLARLQASADDLRREFQGRTGRHLVHLQMTGARARAGTDSFGEGVGTLVRSLVERQEKKSFVGPLPSEGLAVTSMLDQLMRRLVTKP